ncbi:hypothetical protein PR202_ga16014 [Eleusine coracana subsp. coracana]|uniref:J domain-containing protein n=1 Tax=Eleusine coracana subsp. coracana TaxID=191504 RepID=A0AAV5CLD1_ELECO|nr:hypothetical protein PR202_ga16014 [Eleusine coracana subsp. coracana]
MARCVGSISNAAVIGRNRSRRVTAAAAAATTDRAGSVCSAKKKSDYYKVLSLEHSPAIGAEAIKRAYRRLALQCHPDVCPPSRRAESTEFFLELRRAYETLSDPAQRLRYDAELRRSCGQAGGGEGVGRRVRQGRVGGAALRAARARSERRQRARAAGTVWRARDVCAGGALVRCLTRRDSSHRIASAFYWGARLISAK